MFKSFGWKRALSIILFIIGEAVPEVAPFKPIIDAVAATLGLTGIAHAVYESDKKSGK